MRTQSLAWYGGVLGGLLPVLLLGFVYSVLADRTVFALWALILGVCWIAVLRHGLAAGWRRGQLPGVLAMLLAAGLAVFALLEARHHEILDLGFRAVFPAAYHPVSTKPGTAGVLAGILALAGLALLPLKTKEKE